MKKKTKKNLKESLKFVTFSLLTAAFIWSMSLGQSWLAYHNFKNGVEAGLNACERLSGTLPNGDLRTQYIAKQAHTDN